MSALIHAATMVAAGVYLVARTLPLAALGVRLGASTSRSAIIRSAFCTITK